MTQLTSSGHDNNCSKSSIATKSDLLALPSTRITTSAFQNKPGRSFPNLTSSFSTTKPSKIAPENYKKSSTSPLSLPNSKNLGKPIPTSAFSSQKRKKSMTSKNLPNVCSTLNYHVPLLLFRRGGKLLPLSPTRGRCQFLLFEALFLTKKSNAEYLCIKILLKNSFSR